MVYVPPDQWNTVFGWMTPKTCTFPDGCLLPWKGILVYVFVLVFVVTLLYWFRHDIKQGALSLWERIPNPFS